jgi:tripartite-type tricarboxylate transporter receptor subunit TctC
MTFRIVACVLAALIPFCSSAAPSPSPAERFPDKPIRVIVPFAPGGGLDLTARLIGQKVTEKWGQNFVVDTRTGAATIVGTEIASRALPDGYTILMITTTFAINPSLYKKLPYDTSRGFTPITQLNSQPNIVVVTPTFAASSVKDLIAFAKAKRGELAFASPGAGSAPRAVPVGSSPQQFAAFLKSEMSKWSRVIKEANIQLEQ